jgi:hypothetical protein
VSGYFGDLRDRRTSALGSHTKLRFFSIPKESKMARNSLLIVACLAGFVACGGSKSPGSGDAGDGGGDGGDAGKPAATTCTTADDTQGDCSWPEFCQSMKCAPPQNLNAQGMSVSNPACITSASTPQGAGNLDTDRMIEDAGVELLAPNSAIITDLDRIPIQQNSDCVMWIGPNTTEFEESANGCMGGNTDAAGNTICAQGEAAMLFQGHAYDPQSHFAKEEGPDLDAQFWWMVGTETPFNFSDGDVFGAAQSGFIIPQAGWSASGGPFVMIQCLARLMYPAAILEYPVTLHFADTGLGGDAGVPGNSYCTQWVE